MPTKTAKAPAPKVTKKELSANNYLMLMIVASVLVVVIAGFFGNMLIGNIITNTKVINGKRTAVKDLDTKLERAPQLINAYEQLGSRQTLIMNALPTTSDFPQIISIAESMGAASGVTIKSVTPAAQGSDAATAIPAAASADPAAATAAATTPAPAGPVATQPTPYNFTIEAEGNYARILELLKNIETSARPFKIGAVTFRGDSGALTVDIQLTTYYMGEAKIEDTTEAVK